MTRFPIRQLPNSAKWGVYMIPEGADHTQTTGTLIFTASSRKQALDQRENLWRVFMEGFEDGQRYEKTKTYAD